MSLETHCQPLLFPICGAVGAGNPNLAGIYLQVAYAVVSEVAVGVFICWNLTERIWVAFGSDPEISRMAGYYARILSLSIPGQLLFTQLSQFFSAQRIIMDPEVNASTCALVLNLVFGLIFILGSHFPNFEGYGLAACPIVTSSAVYVRILILWYFYIHKQRRREPAWGGWMVPERDYF
jgi:Na+-driven multidrug efflux pump